MRMRFNEDYDLSDYLDTIVADRMEEAKNALEDMYNHTSYYKDLSYEDLIFYMKKLASGLNVYLNFNELKRETCEAGHDSN